MARTKLLETTIDSSFMRPDLVRGRSRVRCGDDESTYDDIATAAQGFSCWLASKGVRPHDRVALWLPNGLAWVVAHVGVSASGAVCVPISTRLTTREASYILGHADVAAVVTIAEFLRRHYADETRRILQDTGADALVVQVEHVNGSLPHEHGATAFHSRPDDAAMLIYTSGTTGVPKGCLLSHRSYTNNARLSADSAQLSGGDVVYCPSPFFHLFGSLTGLMGAAEVGASFVTDPLYDPGIALKHLRASRASRMVAVPTVWLDLMAASPRGLGNLQGGLWGGAGFPASALEKGIDHFRLNLNPIYGMTEAPTVSQGRLDDTRDEKLTTVGQPTPMVEVKIAGSDDPVDVDQGGEILVRGYNTMLGYFKDKAATAARWKDGWFKTGDLGLIRASGHLVVTGRITDMIISGGANIYPREIENVILEIPGVAMAAAVPRSDLRLGEVPVVWVVPDGTAALDQATVLARCREQLAQYKVPHQVYLVDKLPLTASGKVHKSALRELANSSPAT